MVAVNQDLRRELAVLKAKSLVRINLPTDLVKSIDILAVEQEMFRYEMFEVLLRRGLLSVSNELVQKD